MTPTALTPRWPVPALNLPLTNGERFVLGAPPSERFDLVVFYRGLHCPICAKYLMELERLTRHSPKKGWASWPSAATAPNGRRAWRTRSRPAPCDSRTG